MNDKQQLAAMGEHMAEQPMCMAKRIEELEAQVLALTVPEGWQLVPVEPTREMIASCDARFIPRIALPVFVAAYKTMLAAAPSPDSSK